MFDSIYSNLRSGVKKVIFSGGIIYFAGLLVHSYVDRSENIPIQELSTFDSSEKSTDQRPKEIASNVTRDPASTANNRESTVTSPSQPQGRTRVESESRSENYFNSPGELEDHNNSSQISSHARNRSNYNGAYIPSNRFIHNNRTGMRSPTSPNDNNLDSEKKDRLGGGFGTPSSGGGEEDKTPSTLNFNPISDDNSSSSSSAKYPSPPSCSHNMAEGVYGAAFEVEITCSEKASISYCLQTGGGCCDPYQASLNYDDPILIGPNDEDYCLTYYALSEKTLQETSLRDILYTLDSTPPALMTSFPKIQLQTTQAPLVNHIQSSDFGKDNHYYHQINLKGHDTTLLGWNCEDIYFDHSTLTTPSSEVIEFDFDVSHFLPSDQLNQYIDISELSYGENFITTLLEDSERNLFSCQTHQITLKDFQFFSLTASAPPTSEAHGSYGIFVPFGHFQEIPNSTLEGKGRSLQSDRYLEYGFFSSTH